MAQPGSDATAGLAVASEKAIGQASSSRPLAAATSPPAPARGEAVLESNAFLSSSADAVTDRPLALLPLNSALVALTPRPAPALPAALALAPEPAGQVPPALARRGRLELRSSTGVFQPNVNFSRTGDSPYPYNPALGVNSPALTEAAAAEYLAQQRSGLSLRLQALASCRLTGHWSLVTGLEMAQLESQSATSYIFTGEQVYDYNQPLQGGMRRATTARYRTLGLPLELQYANPVKTGFSLYGRVGAVISALLSSRTEVEANPEATRTYTLLSASTPYRRLLGSVRGAAGVRFRPVGHDYSFSLGPVAEGGLWSLNAHPAQDFFGQYRPYSFGLEAGVEFGRGAKPTKPE